MTGFCQSSARILGVLLAVIALIGYFVASLSALAPWLMLIAFIVLAVGNLFEGI